MKIRSDFILFCILAIFISCQSSKNQEMHEIVPSSFDMHRPQFHFTPDSAWMNDPNGMVKDRSRYNLFYQYYPDSTVPGPMHWGHAITYDLINWERKPVALFPDDQGVIFSGSAAVDRKNLSGFGSENKYPLVAIYTIHDSNEEQAGIIGDETQGIAYSLDRGESWIKYENNPVLQNPGIGDFRDPKVSWHEESSRWVMSLAVKDHIRFYASDNLIDWELLSEFGNDVGSHDGVWECPDLFQLPVSDSDESKWVLFVSINPGGPNKGSATQYFVGDFDGRTFIPDNVTIKWIDYGPDNYAGVTWSNSPEKIFLGWMSNWLYGQKVPTERWRGAMTIPRSMSLKEIDGEYFIKSWPHKNIIKLYRETYTVISKESTLPDAIGRIDISGIENNDFRIILSNGLGEKVIVGYWKETNEYYIDRSGSGIVDFHEQFKEVALAPRISKEETIDISLVIDHASVEVFADGGLSTMTAIFFPHEVLKNIIYEIENTSDIKVTEFNPAYIH